VVDIEQSMRDHVWCDVLQVAESRNDATGEDGIHAL